MTTISTTTEKLLQYALLPGVGPVTLRKLASDPEFANQAPYCIAEQQPVLRRALDKADSWDTARAAVQQQLDAAQKSGARIISFLDPDYPRLLLPTRDDPGILYIRGSLHSYPDRSVAIIGTRKPTGDGLAAVQAVTSAFVETGWSIISGLALGCDAAAHETALEQRGHTVAVLAHGLHTISPRQHRHLAARIVDSGGALISEFPFGKGAIPAHFVNRDKTQAGLAQGVVMIQSAINGGSLHASRASLKNGRWLAVPAPTESDRLSVSEQVAANSVLAFGEDGEAAELLQCDPADLARLRVFQQNREDMERLAGIKPEPLDDTTCYR